MRYFHATDEGKRRAGEAIQQAAESRSQIGPKNVWHLRGGNAAFSIAEYGKCKFTYDTCLRDSSGSSLFQWNSTTGQYKFTRCSDGFMLTGTGTVGLVNGIRTLTDFKTDRRISAGFNTGQLNGNATIYLLVAQGVWQVFRISETIPTPCLC